MRIGFFYKLFKEGKVNCTQQEMSELWKLCESLNPYTPNSRKIMESYSLMVKEAMNSEEETKQVIKRLNNYFENVRRDSKHCQLSWIFGPGI